MKLKYENKQFCVIKFPTSRKLKFPASKFPLLWKEISIEYPNDGTQWTKSKRRRSEAKLEAPTKSTSERDDYPCLVDQNGFTGTEWPTNNKTLDRRASMSRAIFHRSKADQSSIDYCPGSGRLTVVGRWRRNEKSVCTDDRLKQTSVFHRLSKFFTWSLQFSLSLWSLAN